MKRTNSVACMVATLIIFATTMLTGCEEITKEGTEAEITATERVKIVVQDSIVHHYDTLPGGIIVVHDSMWFHDSTKYSYILTQVHWMWSVNAGYLYGTDSVYLKKYDANGLCGSWQTTASHKGTVNLSVGTSPYPTSVVGDTLWLSAQGNGLFSGTIAGHYVSLTLGNQVMEQTPVIMDNKDWREYLQPHNDAVGQFVVFGSDNVARGRVIGLDGSNAGDVPSPYTTGTNPPTGDTVVVDTLDHISSDATGVANGSNGIIYSEHNTKTSKTYVNGVLVSISPRNFAGKYPYSHYGAGNYTVAMIGRSAPFVGNTATLGGYALTVTPGAMYTVPSGYETDLVSMNVTHHHDSIVGFANGVTVYGHWHCPCHADVVTTFFIPKTPTDTTTRRETGRDTSWQCGSVTNSVVSSNAITHTIVRTGTETTHYNLPPLTSTRTLTGTTNYIDGWYVSGQASPAAIGTSAALSTDPITGAYTVTIGGATLVITPGNHNWCVLDYGLMVTLTSNGFEVPFVYNMVPGTVTLPVTFNTPDIDLPGHLDCLYIDDSFVGNGSGMTTWMCGMWTMSDGSHYHRRVLLANWANASSWTSESVTATEYTNFMAHLSDVNYALAAITSVGTPSGAGYLVHNSDQTTGDYWKTMDGINRNHCNIGGYANGWDGHNPIHFRNIVGGTVNINETVHGITVIGSVQ